MTTLETKIRKQFQAEVELPIISLEVIQGLALIETVVGWWTVTVNTKGIKKGSIRKEIEL